MTDFSDPRQHNPYNSRLTPECQWIAEHSPRDDWRILPRLLWRELMLLVGLVLTCWYVRRNGWL